MRQKLGVHRLLTMGMLLLVFASVTYGQRGSVRGRICWADSTRQIDEYQVFVQDTTEQVIYMNVFTATKFKIDASEVAQWKTRQALITVSVLGCERKSILLDLDKNTGEEIVFELTPSEMQAVVVTKVHPKAQIKDGKLSIRISNSYLAHVGSLQNLLRLTPGIIQTEDGLKVLGAGTPVIMINKRVARREEFQSLQSRDILSIEIDRNPSAEFGAETKAVIWVTTKEKLSDLTDLLLSSDAKQASLFTHSHAIQGNLSRRSIKAVLRAGYDNWNTRIQETNVVKLYSERKEVYFLDSTKSYSSTHQHSFDLSGAFEYYFSAPHLVGLSYAASLSKDRQQSNGEQFNFMNETESRHKPIGLTRNRGHNHAVTLYYYNASLPKHWIYASASYIKKVQRTSYQMRLENDENQTFIDYDRTYNYDGANVYLKYTFVPSKLWNISLGTSDNWLTNKQSLYKSSASAEEEAVRPRLYNFSGSAYANLLFKKDKVSASLGLRYEYNYTSYQDKKDTWRKSQNLYPSLYVRYQLKEDYQFALQYRYYNQHPSYSSLDPQIYYQNQFVYAQGNPLLKSAQIHYVGTTASLWRQANLSLSFRQEKNPISFIATQGEFPHSIKMHSVNTDHLHEWKLSLDETASWSAFSLFVSASLRLPQVEIYRENVRRRKSYLCYDLSAMLSWTPCTWLSAYVGCDYFSRSYSNFNVEAARNNLKAGINCTFWSRLDVGLEANDLLQGMNFGRWRMNLPNLNIQQDGVSDMRAVSLNISYRLGSAKTKALDLRGGDEIKSRL